MTRPEAIVLALFAILSLAYVSDWHTSGNVVYDNTFFDDTTVANERTQAGAGSPTYTQIVDGAYAYSLAIGDGVRFSMQNSHRMKTSSSLDMHVHIIPDGTDAGGGNVAFLAECCAIDAGEACASTPDILSPDAAIVGGAPGKVNTYVDVGDLNSFSGLSSISLCSLTRVAATTDDYSGEVFLLAVDGHYEIDGPGSQSELIK